MKMNLVKYACLALVAGFMVTSGPSYAAFSTQANALNDLLGLTALVAADNGCGQYSGSCSKDSPACNYWDGTGCKRGCKVKCENGSYAGSPDCTDIPYDRSKKNAAECKSAPTGDKTAVPVGQDQVAHHAVIGLH